MHKGTPLDRQWVFVLKNGVVAVDWGNGLAQDLATGEFFHFEEQDFSHAAYDHELEILQRQGRILGYDQQRVYVGNLPELPRRTLDE